jgi:hypothetical protein
LRAATIILLLSIGIGPASADWQDATETTPPGKKIVMQRTPGKATFQKAGREVTATLYLRCDNPYDDRTRYRGWDYWSVFVLFSEPVSSVEARTNYSFDGGQGAQSTFMFNPRGTAMFLTQQDDDTDFVKRLASSQTLQLSPDLAWAGKPTLTFNTAGAAAALAQVPCNKKF